MAYGGARIAGIALLFAAGTAFAQTSSSCFPLAVLSGPGGGGLDGGSVVRTPGTSVSLGLNDCFQSVAYTTLWSPSGQTTSTAIVTAPPPGVTQTHTVRTTSASAIKTGAISIIGANAGSPVCTMSAPTTTPSVGQTIALTVSCSPAASSYTWSSSSSDITLVSGQNTTQATYTFVTATPSGVHRALYMHPSNAAGSGQSAVAAFTVASGPTVAAPPAVPVSPGAYHTCALVVDGSVKCWGRNDLGQIGDATTSNRSFPAPVVGLGSGVTAVSTGSFHSCALFSNGGAKCWGSGASGALGDGSTVASATTPVTVTGFPAGAAGALFAISSGYEHTCGVGADTRVWCWGKNDVGQLNGVPGANRPVAVAVQSGTPPNTTNITDMVAVVAAQNHSCALSSTGGVKCWGDNQVGQTGSGSTNLTTSAVDVAGLASGVKAIAANGFHTCALTTGGGVKCWGRNASGRLGDGTTTDRFAPVDVVGLSSGVTAIAVGGTHSCALLSSGNVMCWGANSHGQVGDGTQTDRLVPVKVVGLPPNIQAIAGGGFFTSALATDGAVYQWGDNSFGQVGDGTLFDRIAPRAVIGVNGTGYLSLTNQVPTVPPQQAPAIPVSVTGSVSGAVADVTVTLTPRPQDAGTNPKIFAYGLAPASLVHAALKGSAEVPDTGIMAKSEGKATSDACKLVQLSDTGQLRGLSSASDLTPFVSSALSALGSSFKLLNNVPTVNIAGVTICLGYGPTPDAMVANGTSQCLLTVPSSVVCSPQPPQTGWWWNPAEGGRGYSIEVRNNKISWAAYLYDATGRATWHVANGAMLFDGALFVGPMYKVVNGQTLAGAYRSPFVSPNNLTIVGTVSLSFTDPGTGRMAWPGGNVPIERMNIVPNGLTATAAANQPESGWWWNADENGRGYFIEWQNGYADLASYMYDDAGNPVWYISVAQTPNSRVFAGTWWLFGGGQTLTGPFVPGAAQRINDNVAPVLIEFSDSQHAMLTLPVTGGGTRKIAIIRTPF